MQEGQGQPADAIPAYMSLDQLLNIPYFELVRKFTERGKEYRNSGGADP